MTNEELQATADALGKQVAEMCYEDYPAVRAAEVLEPALRALVSQAFEEAIKATCPHCARGIRVELLGRDQCPDLAEVGSLDEDDAEAYIHRRDDRELFANYLCDAQSIRALKDSLAQEPVSSS